MPMMPLDLDMYVAQSDHGEVGGLGKLEYRDDENFDEASHAETVGNYSDFQVRLGRT